MAAFWRVILMNASAWMCTTYLCQSISMAARLCQTQAARHRSVALRLDSTNRPSSGGNRLRSGNVCGNSSRLLRQLPWRPATCVSSSWNRAKIWPMMQLAALWQSNSHACSLIVRVKLGGTRGEPSTVNKQVQKILFVIHHKKLLLAILYESSKHA